MFGLILLLTLAASVLISLIIYGIYAWIQKKHSDVELNKDAIANFRQSCLQSIVASAAAIFSIPLDDTSVKTEQTSWFHYKTTVMFDAWTIWIVFNWWTHRCTITCQYFESNRRYVKSRTFNISHNIINEVKLQNFFIKVVDDGFKVAYPVMKDRIVSLIVEARSLANSNSINDEQLIQMFFDGWLEMPFKRRADAERFVRLTSFLLRFHHKEVKDFLAKIKNKQISNTPKEKAE